VNDLGVLPIGAATLDNAALFNDGTHGPVVLIAPTSITVYGVYLPVIFN
jgi:hypothetical protein